MSLSSDISTISSSLNAIKNAIIDKGVTPTGNITTYADAISQISGTGTLVAVVPASSQVWDNHSTLYCDFSDGYCKIYDENKQILSFKNVLNLNENLTDSVYPNLETYCGPNGYPTCLFDSESPRIIIVLETTKIVYIGASS